VIPNDNNLVLFWMKKFNAKIIPTIQNFSIFILVQFRVFGIEFTTQYIEREWFDPTIATVFFQKILFILPPAITVFFTAKLFENHH